VVRLVRSKGVGVYFVTQNPLDVPQTVLGQLGNRVQHALRAFTPRDQQAVRAAATTFRANPALDVEKVIGELAVGEALISFLDEKGRPNVVERGFVVPPGSRLGPLSADERKKVIASSLVAGHYEKAVDRESAHEKLKARTEDPQAPLSSTLAKTSKAILGAPLEYSEAALETIMSPAHFVEVRATHGGPSPKETSRAIAESQRQLHDDRESWQLRRQRIEDAEARLEAKVKAL
jgi:hypothetical protein